jgi:Xaa-Pro aminopeptidase
MNYEHRIARARGSMRDQGAGGLLVTNSTNVCYLTGFTGTNGQLLISADGATFLTDPRYEARASDMVRGADVKIYPSKLTERLPDLLAAIGIERLGFEAATVTVATRDDLAKTLDEVELVATTGVIEDLRRTKDDDELERIRRAVAITDEVFALALGELSPGRTEREIGLWLEIQMRQRGAEAVSFEPIVGSGPLSAHIHHSPSHRTLEKGDFVLLDFGCKFEGYCSDMTRTVVLGPASEEQQETYDLVLEAQRTGANAIAAGERGPDVDAKARRVIASAGREEHFGHGLGHGVGLDVHEAPRLHKNSGDTLRAGDIVTVEPGVYVPGRGGVRIEDCVLVTEDGHETLTSAPKDELLEV